MAQRKEVKAKGQTKAESRLKSNSNLVVPVTKLTPALVDKLCSYLEQGNYIETACDACYITDTTYRNWIKRAEQELADYAQAYDADRTHQARFSVHVDFMLRARKSVALAEIDDIDAIRSHAQGWQSRGWIREHRRSRTDWTRPTGATAQPTTTNVNILNVTGDDIGKALAAHDAQIIEQAQVRQLDT